jgi:hypothetical protein
MMDLAFYLNDADPDHGQNLPTQKRWIWHENVLNEGNLS